MTRTEPVALVAAITGAVRAVLAALVILDALKLSDEALAAVVVAVEAVLQVPLTVWARGRVTPVPVDA